MGISKTILALVLSLGLLVSVTACGKRGDPIRPSEVVTDSAS